MALKYADLLREGTEAGDFGEWSSDRGVKLDCANEAFCIWTTKLRPFKLRFRSCQLSFKTWLKTTENPTKNLWGSGFEEALDSRKELDTGRATLEHGLAAL